MTAPQLVTGVARAANWALASLLAAVAAGSCWRLGASAARRIACALYSLLALAVLWRHPLAYLAVATLTFLEPRRRDAARRLAIAAGNGVLFALALFVRSQLRIRGAPT